MANLNSEERRKRYSRWNRNEDIEQSEANKDSNVITKADERRNRYASKDYLEKYNAYHTPTRSDGSALNRYMNVYGLNQQRSAERQQEARSRYNQQQFMNNQRRYVNGEDMNPNGLSTMKTLNDPINNQRLARNYADAYQKSTGISVEQNNNLERLYGSDRKKLKQAKEDLERTHQNNTPEYNWIKNKLVSTASAEENEERQNTLNRLIGEADDKLASYADKVVGSGIDNPEYLAQVESIKKEKEKLENELESYKDNIDYTTAQDYKYYKAKGDADKSNHVKFVRENSDETIAKYWNDYDYGMQDKNLYNGVVDFPKDEDFIRAITQDEADQYSYLLGKYGEEKAEEYLKGLAKHTDVNGAITKMQEAQEQGKKNFWQSTAESIGLGLLTPAEAVKNVAGFGGKYRTYDDYAIAGRQEALRSGAVQAIQDTNLPGSENVLPFLYNTGSSTADNLLRYLVGGAAGSLTGSASVGEGAMRFMMAGQVGDSAMKQALDRGLTDSQAATTAIISAINEELFETISLSELKAMQTVKPSSYKELAKNVGKQLLGEGSEEVFTDIGNAIADDLVNGEKSEIRTNIRNYIDQGMSEEEAKKQASVDFAMQLVESGLSGGLSGAAMGGLVTTQQANDLDNQKKFEQLAQNYIDAGLSEEEAYNAAENDVKANVKTVRDRKGNIKNYKGVKKSLVKAIESTRNLSDNLSKIEQEMKTGVADTTSISDAQNLNETENRFNEAQNEYADTQSEYINDMQQLLSTEVNNVNDYDTLMEKTDALAKVYPEKRVEISNAVSQVYGSGRDSAEVINELKETNTSPVNETSLKPQINASEEVVANNATTETLPQKMEFKAAVDGNEGVITSVNKNNITIKDATGNEQTVAIKDAQMSDGAMAAVDQAKQYGVNGSRLYLENLMSDNLRNYTVAFNSYYNAGKQGKSFYGLGTFGLMSNTKNNAKVREFLREVYDAGVRDNSKTKKQGGLVRNDARYSVNEVEARTVDVLAKAAGSTVQFDKMLSHDANGYYDSENDIIHISTTSQNPSMVVFSHELTHRLKQTSKEAYQEYENYVIDYLKNQTKKDESGIDQNLYETMFAELKIKYSRQGVSLSDAAVNEEIVANATEAFLTDGEAINNFVENSDKNVVQKIIDVIKSIIDDIKEVFGKEYEVKNAGAKAIKANLDVYNHALELWLNAIEKQDAALIQNKKSNSDVKYSMESTEGLDEEIKENINTVLDMDSVATINKVNNYSRYQREKYRNELLNNLLKDRRIKNTIINNESYKTIYKKRIGNIIVDMKSIKNLTQYNHMTSLGNMFNFNILDIISDGKIVYYEENRDGNNPDYAIIAAPVNVNIDGYEDNGTYLVGVAVKLTSKNRLYIVRAEADFIRKKEAELLSRTSSMSEKSPSRAFATTKNSASDINIILDNIIENNMQKKYGIETAKKVRELRSYKYKNAKVKSNERNILKQKSNKELEVDYNAAVKAGNEEETKKIVEQYAKNKGYNYKAFHGTNEPTFYVFDVDKANHATARFINGSFHSENEDVAKIFADVNTKLKGGKSRVIKTYLKMKKPLFLTGERFLQTGFDDKVKKEILNEIKEGKYDSIIVAPRNYQNNEYAKLGVEWAAKGIIDPASNNSYKETKEYAVEKGYTKEEADKIYSGITNPDFSHVQYAVFSPEQIKSADAVTYDDEGNVIPLSERFNKSNDDIRFSLKEDSEGRQLSPQQQEFFKDSKVVDENGNLKVMYHGTETPGFTTFNPSNRKGYSDNYNAIFLTNNKDVADTYTNNKGVYPLYVNAENPYVVDVKGQTFHNWSVKNYDKKYTNIQLEPSSEGHLFAMWHEDDDPKMKYGTFTKKELKDKFGEKIGIFDFADDTYIGVIYLDKNGNNIPTSTDDCILHAKNNGYDSVIFNNIKDMGRFADDYKESQVVAVFNSNQVKNVDNKKPTDNPDIRYSLKESNDFYKETGFDVRTLTDPTPENIIWYASRNERAINKYLEDRKVNIEPVIVDKKINNSLLGEEIVKDYIMDNNIDAVLLVADENIRNKFFDFIENEYINKLDKPFRRKMASNHLEAIKTAINGDDYTSGAWRYNFDKLDEDINSIKNPTQEEDKYATKDKKQDYVEEHYNDFEKYLGDKIEKIFGWSLNGEKEKASDEDKERHVEDAINRFGILSEENRNWNKGAYITLTGDVLDFGGKGSDIRSHDHRDISAVYDEDESTKYRLFNPTDYLNQFLSEGNVRIMPESSSIDMNSNEEPNSKQYATIRDYIDDYAAETGKCIIEFSDDDGKSVDSKYYENNINSSQIINDIKRFYREGKIGGSNLNQFRFSLKEESNIDRNTVAAVTGKDPYMAEAVKDLEDIMRMKGGESFFRANQRELYKIYDEIAKEYNIKDYSKKIFAENMNELFDYIQSVDAPNGIDTTMLAMQIANDMLENGSIIDTTMEDMYPMLQQQLRDYKIKIADQDKADLDAVGGYNAFRKQYFGNLTLSNEGTEVDTVYEDLAASYPELFPEDIVAPGDRLMRIADVVDMFKRTVDHIEGATREESAFIIAQDIINKAVLEQTKNNKSIDNKKRLKAQEKVRKQNTNLKKAKKDIHDDYIRLQNKVKALESINERLDRQLTKAENELGRQKKEFADWAAGKRQVNKEDKYYKQKYDKLMQEFSKKKVAELQKKYSAERRKNIEKIRKMVKELDRSVRRPDKNHYVPPYLVKSMLDVLRTIDLDSGYRKPDGSETLVYMKLKDMQKQYQEMQNDMDYAIASEYNETIDKAIGRLAEITRGRRINELLDKDIADIVEVMEIINYQMRTARDLLENEKLSDIKEASQKAREQIKEAGRTFNTDAKLKNLFNRYLNNSLSPVRVMRRLEGYAHDGVLSSLGEELQQGERKTKLIRQTANEMLDELYKDTKAIKALEKFRSEKLTYNIGGKNIVITPDMRAAIYLHSLNEQNMKHVVGNKTKEGSYRGGGIIIPNYQKQMKFNNRDSVKVNAAEKYTGQDAVRLSPSDVDRIIKDMTEYDKRIVELYQQVNEYLTKELNDTTMNLYGFKKATVKNYFPLIVDKSILNLDSDALKFDKTLESFGFLKERVNSAKPIYLEGVMDALERQIDQSSLFSGMAIPSRDFKKVWNYAAMDENDKFDNVNKQAQKAMGSYIDKYVGNLQADLAQARERGTDSGFLNLFSRGKMAAGALTGNISVVLKQAASYPTAAGGVLGYQDLLNGLMPHGQRGKTLEETMKHYTPLYEDRNTAAIAGVNINDMNLLKRRNPKLYYALTGWIEAMDKATVRRLWYASENYVKRNFKYEVGSDAYYEEVAKVWEDTIRKTQPIYDTMNRPEYLRQTNELLKYLMMFKTQAFQNVGIMVENYGEYKARVKDYKKDKSDFNKKELNLATKQLRKSVTSQIIQSIIFTGITALVDATIKHRPDKWADEETGLLTPESLSTKLFDAWTSNVISQLAFGDIIRDSIVNPVRTRITGKEVQRFDISVAPIDAINTIINGLNKSSKYAADGDMDKSFAEIKKVASTASQYGLGLPVNNIENLYNGLKGNINDIKSGKNPLEATNEKQMYNRVFIAYAAGDKAEAERLSKDLDQDKLKTKMVSKLKDEKTIQEAADYRYNSDLANYQAIVDAYVKLGFNEDWVVSAINSDMNKKYGTKGSVSKGSTYNSSDLSRAIDISAVQGSKVAQSLYDDKYNEYIAEGMSKDEASKKAMSSVKSSITSQYKPKFEAGNTSEKVKIRDRLASIKVNGEKLYTYDSIKKWND